MNSELTVFITGNTDGLINPNENCTIAFTLKNWGVQTATNVEATISALNPDYVEIISTDPIGFGDLSSGDDFTGDPFQIFIKPLPRFSKFSKNLCLTSPNFQKTSAPLFGRR